jgi:metal-sulfur cluster biosynthetic enzyme
MMSDDRSREVNPHTGQAIPDEPFAPTPPSEGAGAAFAADVRNAPAESGASGGAAPTSAAAAPSQQELAVRSALETVMDPEINLSVIDLGLIREVLFHADPPRTLVRMMLTTPFCPYAPQLMEDVKQATMSVVPQPCEVEIMPDPWSPDLMPDPGLLGYSF